MDRRSAIDSGSPGQLLRTVRTVMCALACLAASFVPVHAAAQTSRVAPLFLHGSGLATLDLTGAVLPLFLDEDDAVDVICAEASRLGVNLTAGAQRLTIPAGPSGVHGRAITLDGSDAERQISFAFISGIDANAARHRQSDGNETIDLRGFAALQRDRIALAAPAGVCVVFYDPAVSITDVLPQLTESERASLDLAQAARQQAEEDLRRQVRDFVAWLGHP